MEWGPTIRCRFWKWRLRLVRWLGSKSYQVRFIIILIQILIEDKKNISNFRYNIDRRSEEVVGTHDEAVNCVLKSREHNLIITGTKKHYFTEYIFKNFRKLGSRGINLGPTRKTSKSCQSTTDRTRLCYRYCWTQISRRNGSKKNFDLGSEKLR